MGLASGIGKFLDDAFNNGNFQDQRQWRRIADQDAKLRKDRGEMAQREEMRHASNDSMRFALDRQKFTQGARPMAADGTVEDILRTPSQIKGVPGFMPEIMGPRKAGPNVSTIIDPQGRSSQYENMSPDELQKRGSRFHTENILADMATKARGSQQERNTYGSQRNVGGQMVQMLPDEIAKNAVLFEMKGQRRTIPGYERFGALTPPEFSEIANILNAERPQRPATERENYFTDTDGQVTRVTTGPDGQPIATPVGQYGKKSRPVAAKDPEAKEKVTFEKIEALKQLALDDAESDFQTHGEPEKLIEAKAKAQRDYEKAIVKAGGSVSARKRTKVASNRPGQRATPQAAQAQGKRPPLSSFGGK